RDDLVTGVQTCALPILTALTVIGKRGHQEWSTWRVKKKGQRRLRALTADERRVLSGYVVNEVRAQIFHDATDLGAAQALANDGKIGRASCRERVTKGQG